MDNWGLFFLIYNLNSKNPLFDFLMIFGAEFIIYLTFILIFLLAIKGGINERKSLIVCLISIPVAVIIIKIIHLFYFYPRPYISFDILPLVGNQGEASFPSRHTSIMAVFAFVYSFYKSRWGIIFWFLTIWVGLSRVYVGVHYPLDILGGIAVGLLSLLISLKIKNFLKSRLVSL